MQTNSLTSSKAFVLCIAVTLSLVIVGCETSETVHNINDNQDVQNQAFLDETLTSNYFDQVAPFEKLNLAVGSTSPVTLAQFTDLTGKALFSQPVLSSNNDTHYALSIPNIEPRLASRRVTVENKNFGQLDLLPLPNFEHDSSPGEYTLYIMNSLLFSLRDELKLAREMDTNSNAFEHLDLQISTEVDNFQRIIGIVDDLVVFNTPIFDTSGNIKLLDSQSLEMLDSTYRIIFANASNRFLFGDATLADSETFTNYPKLIFEGASNVAETWMREEQGYQEVSSLTLILDPQNQENDYKNLKTIFDIFRASIFPSILATSLKDQRLGRQPTTNLDDISKFLTNIEVVTGNTSSFIYTEALSTFLESAITINAYNEQRQ